MRSKATVSKQLLVLIYLLFSSILFTYAVPSTRSLKSSTEDISSSVPYLVAQGEDSEVESAGDGFFEGRMDLEKNDYPDPGPNKGHDPKVPGVP
ncbi:hypothetical protein CDL15_Pgr001276 [Punica granatum]|uniref:Transmembrane protein n=1 Tax=Punica granatum TaxID=22663 RepID=A0A218WMC4_PUNGR|nr:hypothetical protein CDL15_Pgr001276 [Punica granatum]PKI69152.1 hypothetical protein CRG98_010419 [Punica granatum]